MEELLKELEETKAKIAEIEKKIEDKQEKESGRWKPQKGDIYWFMNTTGSIGNSNWYNDNIDKCRYLIGNCYQTKEECESAIEKLKVIAELKEYEEPKNRAWDGIISHYYIYYDYGMEGLDIGYAQIVKQNEIYFESKEKVRQAIDAIGEDRIKKYYLEVEE